MEKTATITDSTNSYPIAPKQESEYLSLRSYWQIIRRRKWTFLIVLFLFILGGGLYTATRTKMYRATASISVIPPQARSVGDVEVEQGYNTQTDYYINTQKEIIHSRGVIRQALERLDDEVCRKFFGKEREQISDDDVREKISIAHRRKTYILEISAVGEFPEQCADIVNLLVKIYMEEHNRREKSPQSRLREWIQRELPERRQKLAESEEKVREFEREYKDLLFLGNREENFDIASLDRLRRELQEVELELTIMKDRYEKCADARKQDSVKAILQLEFFEENQLLRKFREREFELEELFEENRLRYQPRHQKMVWLTKSLDNTRHKIRQEAHYFIHRQEQKYLHLLRKKQQLEDMLKAEKDKLLREKQVFIDYQHTQREYELQLKTYNSFFSKMEEITSANDYQVSNVDLVHEAVHPSKPYRPRMLFNYMVSALLGVLFALGSVFFFEQIDDTVKSTAEVKEITASPVLGKVPFISSRLYGKELEQVVSEYAKSPIAEAFRSVGTNFLLAEQGQRSFVITSPLAGDGKTTISCNLARIIASSSKKVVLIDGDLHKPRLQKCLKLPDGPGFSELLQGEQEATQIAHQIDDNFYCITAGTLPKDPYHCIYNSPLQKIVEELQQCYDYVIFDSPPIGLTSEALLIAKADVAVLLVVAFKKCRKTVLQQILQRIETLEIPLRGIVLNSQEKEDLESEEYYYYSRSYYGS